MADGQVSQRRNDISEIPESAHIAHINALHAEGHFSTVPVVPGGGIEPPAYMLTSMYFFLAISVWPTFWATPKIEKQRFTMFWLGSSPPLD
jgi:hypothetical protein